jgi:hypothetical protein
MKTTGTAIIGVDRGCKPRLARLNEAVVWQPLQSGWRPLYGGFYESGVSIEWHDFKTVTTFEWSRSFHPDSLELCLNLTGAGSIRGETAAMDFEPLTAGFYLPGKEVLQASRGTGQQHQFITIEFSAAYLREHLAACDGALHPLVQAFVRNRGRRPAVWESCVGSMRSKNA